MRAASERVWADGAHGLLDELLRAFGAGYERRKRQESALDFEDLELLDAGAAALQRRAARALPDAV